MTAGLLKDVAHRLDFSRLQSPNVLTSVFVACNATGEVASNSSYNLIIAKLVFHYIDDLEMILGNLRSKLNDDGKLLFLVLHPDNTQSHFISTIKEATYVDEVGKFGLTLPMMHRLISRLTNVLDVAGFGVKKQITIYDRNRPRRINILARKLQCN